MTNALMKPPVAPGARPLIGNALQLARRRLEFITSLPVHGEVVHVRIGPVTVYVACSPDAVHQLLADPRTFDKGGPVYEKGRELGGNGLLTCNAAEHRRQRRLVQPAFHKKRLAQYADIMVKEASAEIDAWQDGDALDVNTRMFTIANRVVTRALFSSELVRTRAEEVGRLIVMYFDGLFWRYLDPTGLVAYLPTPVNRRYRYAVRRLHAAVDEIVETYHAGGTDHGDLLSMLLSARDEDGDALSPTEVHDQVVNFLVAGTETTAATLAWALHLLSTRPKLSDRLAAEAGALEGRPLGWDALPQLALTRAVVLETLRVFPAPWLFSRTATRDAQLAGYRIPAGSSVFYSSYLIHHRPGLPEQDQEFAPERWLADDNARRAPATFIPFGSGARKCIGDEFALTEATLVLALITARYRLEPIPGELVRPIARATLRPSAYRLRLRQRPRPVHATSPPGTAL
jgi:cytochrome P450